jgi:transposase-like protein
MVQCKSCQSEKFVKNGIVRGEQRYRCKGCGLNLIRPSAKG